MYKNTPRNKPSIPLVWSGYGWDARDKKQPHRYATTVHWTMLGNQVKLMKKASRVALTRN